MKWLVIIVIILAILAAMAWLRTARQGPGTTDSRQPHRLDESLSPPASADLHTQAAPPTADGPRTAAGAAAEAAEGNVPTQPSPAADPDLEPPAGGGRPGA